MASATQAVGLAVIMLFVAIALPALIAGAEGGTVERQVTITGGVGDTSDIQEALIVTLRDKTSGTVDIGLTSAQTGDTANVTLTEEETASVTLDNQTVTVTALDVQTGTDGDVTVRAIYPNDFAWSDDARRLTAQLPIVFAAVAFIILLGFVGVMVS